MYILFTSTTMKYDVTALILVNVVNTVATICEHISYFMNVHTYLNIQYIALTFISVNLRE